MPKASGIGDNFYAGAFNISGDINSLGAISAPLATLDVTDITQSAPERIAGLADGNISFTALWNSDADHAVDIFRDMSRADVQLSYFHTQVVGAPAASMVAKKLSFEPNRGADGDLKVGVTAQANGYGLEWGKQLTPGVFTSAVNFSGTGLDTAASAAFGGQLYVHIFGLTGTDAIVSVQHSNDDGVGDAYAAVDSNSAGFTATGVGSFRTQTGRTATVKRWVRIRVTGTFTNLVIAANFVKNQSLVNF
jgi:hypothetical protein